MTAVIERAVVFACQGQHLVGVVSLPSQPADTAVLIIVGGPQYRAGSHRQFVQLARRLAEQGVGALRFDVRGMGDSTGPLTGFEHVDDDIGAALDEMTRQWPKLRRIVLWGLCDGASAALMYWQATRDQRVGGLCLINPWTRSGVSLARAHIKHYYWQRLAQKAFWAKLLSGQVAGQALRDLLRNLHQAFSPRAQRPESTPALNYAHRMAAAWATFPGPIMLGLSGKDFTAKEFLENAISDPAWAGSLQRPGLHRVDLDEADHTFSSAVAQQAIEAAILVWLRHTATVRS